MIKSPRKAAAKSCQQGNQASSTARRSIMLRLSEKDGIADK
jgi:hypothetical protein